jgi:hypothetical protein
MHIERLRELLAGDVERERGDAAVLMHEVLATFEQTLAVMQSHRRLLLEDQRARATPSGSGQGSKLARHSSW